MTEQTCETCVDWDGVICERTGLETEEDDHCDKWRDWNHARDD